ncbi:hypothetical protein OUZ56_024568 [Daphnia magna]|uniref:Uncharacterized protein n=1 Tax=Daphnia magna TaxID=35525 RepID=A0ABR0B0Z6_9CRUS|nr:hypothetical protein OUZ56_024568 [Daphnia magna]
MMSLFNKPVNNTTEGLPRNERNLSITQLPATKLKPQSTIDSPVILISSLTKTMLHCLM